MCFAETLFCPGELLFIIFNIPKLYYTHEAPQSDFGFGSLSYSTICGLRFDLRNKTTAVCEVRFEKFNLTNGCRFFHVTLNLLVSLSFSSLNALFTRHTDSLG